MKFLVTAMLAYSALVSTLRGQTANKLTFEKDAGHSIPLNWLENGTNASSDLPESGWKFTPGEAGLLAFKCVRSSLDYSLHLFRQTSDFKSFRGLSVNPRFFFHARGEMSRFDTAQLGFSPQSSAFTDPSQTGAYCERSSYCESAGPAAGAEFRNDKRHFEFVIDVSYDRFLANANDEFSSVSFGIRY
jgi:hypothetical protein